MVGVLAAFSPHSAGSATARPPDAQPLTVVTVLAGDTVILSSAKPGGQIPRYGDVTARLLGLNAPNFGIIDECFAEESQARLRELLPVGSVVWATVDRQPQDEGGRWLAYLWTADGRFVNYELTVDGLAEAAAMPPNDELLKVIEAGQTYAVARLWGIWGECGH